MTKPLPLNISPRDMFAPAMGIASQRSADRYFQRLVEHNMRKWKRSQEWAEKTVRSNLRSYASLCGGMDEERFARIMRLFRIAGDGAHTPVRLAELEVTEYQLLFDEYSAVNVTLVLRRGRNGLRRWSIFDGVCVMNRKGAWEFEPSPSSRTDAFLKRTRFATPEAALKVWSRDPHSRTERIRKERRGTRFSFTLAPDRPGQPVVT